MTKKTALDFKEAAKRIKAAKWFVRLCSICRYPCGYVFSADYEHVGYDSGCYCVKYENIQPRDWEYLAEYYNMQCNENVIKKMDEFWGFNNCGDKIDG